MSSRSSPSPSFVLVDGRESTSLLMGEARVEMVEDEVGQTMFPAPFIVESRNEEGEEGDKDGASSTRVAVDAPCAYDQPHQQYKTQHTASESLAAESIARKSDEALPIGSTKEKLAKLSGHADSRFLRKETHATLRAQKQQSASPPPCVSSDLRMSSVSAFDELYKTSGKNKRGRSTGMEGCWSEKSHLLEASSDGSSDDITDREGDEGQASKESASSGSLRRDTGKARLVEPLQGPFGDIVDPSQCIHRSEHVMLKLDKRTFADAWNILPPEIQERTGAILLRGSQAQTGTDDSCETRSDKGGSIRISEAGMDAAEAEAESDSDASDGDSESLPSVQRRGNGMMAQCYRDEQLWVARLPYDLSIPVYERGYGNYPNWLHPAFHIVPGEGQPRPDAKLLET